MVRDSLRYKVHNETYWSDSSIVLGWLHASFKTLKTFVANRISEICELTDSHSWRHVPTSLNPADLISRGVNPIDIKHNELWWSGPQYLLHFEDSWPVLNTREVNIQNLPEIKQISTIINLGETVQFVIKFENYSSYNTLI